jgi:hypothetical protein
MIFFCNILQHDAVLSSIATLSKGVTHM